MKPFMRVLLLALPMVLVCGASVQGDPDLEQCEKDLEKLTKALQVVRQYINSHEYEHETLRHAVMVCTHITGIKSQGFELSGKRLPNYEMVKRELQLWEKAKRKLERVLRQRLDPRLLRQHEKDQSATTA